VVSFMNWSLYFRGKSPRQPQDRRLRRSRSRSGRCDIENNLVFSGSSSGDTSRISNGNGSDYKQNALHNLTPQTLGFAQTPNYPTRA
jgi:hypothetical protein